MISFKRWFEINGEKLSDEYDEYLDTIEGGIIIPMDFDEFVLDKFEDSVSDFEDYEYENFKQGIL